MDADVVSAAAEAAAVAAAAPAFLIFMLLSLRGAAAPADLNLDRYSAVRSRLMRDAKEPLEEAAKAPFGALLLAAYPAKGDAETWAAIGLAAEALRACSPEERRVLEKLLLVKNAAGAREAVVDKGSPLGAVFEEWRAAAAPGRAARLSAEQLLRLRFVDPDAPFSPVEALLQGHHDAASLRDIVRGLREGMGLQHDLQGLSLWWCYGGRAGEESAPFCACAISRSSFPSSKPAAATWEGKWRRTRKTQRRRRRWRRRRRRERRKSSERKRRRW